MRNKLTIAFLFALLASPAFGQRSVPISALPAASTPLSGSEITAVVQSGVTKRATVDQILAGGTAAGVTSFNGRHGVVVSVSGDYSFSLLTGQATLAQLPSLTANSIYLNASGSTAVPSAVALPSCSTASSALTYNTTSHALGCNSIGGGGGSGVTSFNTRTGAVTLSSGDVTTALGFTPPPNFRTVSAGTGLSGGGDLTANRTFALAAISADSLLANATVSSAAPTGVSIGSCSTASSALTYNTSTHAFGCNTISGSAGPANPTATIGATAVNGSAGTFMRSDAAPALPSTLPALNGSLLTNLTAANLSGTVPASKGGTGLDGSAAANGRLLIGNGTGYTLASLTAGANITITPGAGSLTIAATGAGTGSVTSVALAVPGASIFGVTGSPVTTSGTLGLTTTGTSGGIPYFSSSSALSSSAALVANLPVFGGGSGVAPFSGTRQGNTTKVFTTTGSFISGNGVASDASGNAVDVGYVPAPAGTGAVVTGSQTPNAADFGVCKALAINAGSLSVTIPAAATLQANGGCYVIATPTGHSVSIIRTGSDTINGVGATATLGAGLTSIVMTDGSAGIFIPGASAAPAVTGTGTPSIVATSNNSRGEVTAGASATSVVITFSGAPLGEAPICTVTTQTGGIASFAYAITTSAITVTQSATSGNIIDYICQ